VVPSRSYAADMKTMQSPTSLLTPVAPSTHRSVGLTKTCVSLTLKALKVVWRAYVEGARYNPYLSGCPGAYVKEDRA
jgi:hypothetical protein